jgi:ribosomal-protein-serine acetyltransferase
VLALPLTDDAELRALEPWQAAEFADFLDRARPHLAPWLPWATTLTNEEEARAFLQTYADRLAADTGRIYGIWVDGVLAGGTLFRVFNVQQAVCEVGVWLGPDAQGRGLITRAARLMIDWAVRDRGMARVEWLTMAHNDRSIAVAKRLGMARDGVLRKGFLHNDERHDVEVWSLLAEEWLTATS